MGKRRIENRKLDLRRMFEGDAETACLVRKTGEDAMQAARRIDGLARIGGGVFEAREESDYIFSGSEGFQFRSTDPDWGMDGVDRNVGVILMRDGSNLLRIPKGVDVTIDPFTISTDGHHGELARTLKPVVVKFRRARGGHFGSLVVNANILGGLKSLRVHATHLVSTQRELDFARSCPYTRE